MPSLLAQKPDLGGIEDYLGYDIPFSGPMPLIAKSALMPIITGPVKGKGAAKLLERIFDLIPEKLYEPIKKVEVMPHKSLGKSYGKYFPSRKIAQIEEPHWWSHPSKEYVDTTVHEILHEFTNRFNLPRYLEEKLVEELTTHYINYATTGKIHPSLLTIKEFLGK